MQETLFVRDLGVVLLVATAAGWAMQRAGLSAVVGYLLAGIFIGPYSPGLKLVSDSNHIQLLSQIGLVFLMFSIGLGLSFARLQRMGGSIVLAVIISSILLFNVCRWFGSAMGWNSIQILFLAGTLMISSSAIIIKVLDELNIMHQRAGQLALGITVLEDLVAVVMLTLFISMIKIGANDAAPIWSTLGALAAFVVFLVGIAMLVVPRVLKGLGSETSSELRIIAVTGLVLLAAIWALEAGYSLALGAFVMGVVVAGTSYKDEIEKSFGALHTIFGAVFFVAVGMMFDYRLLAQVWWLVALVTLLTVVARPLACAFGLVAVGHSGRNALKAGISLVAIGEFAFVLIQVGRSANVLPEQFFALGIGVSLATAVISPLLTRRSEAIVDWIQAREPRALRTVVGFYHRWLEALRLRTNGSLLWRLTSKRVIHAALHLLFVSAIIGLSKPAYEFALAKIGAAFPFGFGLLFWSLFALAILGPIIVLWRNLEALAMIVADGATAGTQWRERTQPALRGLLRGVSAFVLIAWLLLLLPVGRVALWALAIAVMAILLYAPRLWRRLVSVHAKVEFELREKLKAASTFGATTGLPASVLERPQEWDLQIDEVTLPFGSEHAGRRIAGLGLRAKAGCSIVAIERQGFLITNPTADEKLFAGDKLLILGASAQLAAADDLLRSGAGRSAGHLEEIAMESIDAPPHGPDLGKPLSEINPVGRFGVQICGIERSGARLLVPSSSEIISAGDKLLLLGAHRNIQAFRSHLWQE